MLLEKNKILSWRVNPTGFHYLCETQTRRIDRIDQVLCRFLSEFLWGPSRISFACDLLLISGETGFYDSYSRLRGSTTSH